MLFYKAKMRQSLGDINQRTLLVKNLAAVHPLGAFHFSFFRRAIP